MEQIYDYNNLPFWSEEDILARQQLSQAFHDAFARALSQRNRAWLVERVEAPMLIPRELLSPEYTEEQIFCIPAKATSLRWPCAQALREDPPLARRLAQSLSLDRAMPDWHEALDRVQDESQAASWPAALDELARAWASESNLAPKELALRPETTPATYAWMLRRLQSQANLAPYCCWQLNKSFRREQDQPAKHVRLKEFWQQEYQCAYASDSHEDWHLFCVEPVKAIIEQLTRCPARIVVSDRLPDYSLCTIDIEVWNSEKWMEICSISKRVDFPDEFRFPAKASAPAREMIVAEVATSPDRQRYCQSRWRQAWENLPKPEWIDHDWRAAAVDNALAAEAKRLRRL